MCRLSLSFLLVASAVLFPCMLPAVENKFNQQEKDLMTNGNFPVAVIAVQFTTPAELEKSSQAVAASDMTKKIYSYLGKPVKIRGKIFKVEELPPMEAAPGVWTEVLMLVNNKNSPVGATTIDYLYKGDASSIDANDVVTCSGYVAGTYESPNALGGKIEAVMIIGNHIKKERR